MVTVIDCPNIAGAKAPVAPVLNTPLSQIIKGAIRKQVKLQPNHNIGQTTLGQTKSPELEFN